MIKPGCEMITFLTLKISSEVFVHFMFAVGGQIYNIFKYKTSVLPGSGINSIFVINVAETEIDVIQSNQ